MALANGADGQCYHKEDVLKRKQAGQSSIGVQRENVFFQIQGPFPYLGMAHRSDGPALSLRCLGMGTEQFSVVVAYACGFLVNNCLQTRQTRQTESARDCK